MNKFNFPLEGVFIPNVFHAEGKAQRTLHAMKYKYRRDVAYEAGSIIVNHLAGLIHGFLVPVPQTPRKRRVRGYNQAEIIAMAIADNSPLELRTSVLGRIGSHRSQTTKTRTDRMKTLGIYTKSCEACTEPVWLVDDVVTTGATLGACISVLREAGVKKIGVMAWATA